MAEKKTETKQDKNPEVAEEKKAQKPVEGKDKEAKEINKPAKGKDPDEKETQKPDTGEGQEEDSYLKDLMAISGHGGLFRFVSQGRNGIIVESIETGKRMQAFATMKVSALEDIAVYTEEEEIQLEQVLAALHKYESGKESISPKSGSNDLKDYFSAVLPDYDRERVYVSDIKKILNWYNLLLKYDLIKTVKKKPAGKTSDKKDTAEEEKPKTKPAVKAPAGKSGQRAAPKTTAKMTPVKKVAGKGDR